MAKKAAKKFKFPRRPAKWTKQNMFNFVCRCLAIQQRRSADRNGDCLYRGPDGMKCAVGHCIPNGEYRPSFDGNGGAPAISVIRKVPSITAEIHPMMHGLQRSHDSSENAKELRGKLVVVAECHGVKPDAADLIRRWR